MATEIFYFKGKAKWAKVYRPDDEFDNYKINVYLDKASKKLFTEAGTQLTPKSDEDGEYVTFRRDHSKMIKNELVVFGKPQVVDHDGLAFTNTIGNGSEVVVKVAVYDGRKGKGHRLEGVQVVNLVEYAGSGDSRPSHAPAGVEAF
jgi:hypothetical protein